MPWLIILIVFFAALVQGMAGFGLALVAMPLLVPLLGLQVASPMLAVVGTVMSTSYAIRFFRTADLRAIIPLFLAAVAGIPLGIVWLKQTNPDRCPLCQRKCNPTRLVIHPRGRAGNAAWLLHRRQAWQPAQSPPLSLLCPHAHYPPRPASPIHLILLMWRPGKPTAS